MNKKYVTFFLMLFFKTQASDNFLEIFPSEVQQKILSYLPIESLLKYREISTNFEEQIYSYLLSSEGLELFFNNADKKIKKIPALKDISKFKTFLIHADNPLQYLETEKDTENSTDQCTIYTIIIPKNIKKLESKSFFKEKIETIKNRKITIYKDINDYSKKNFDEIIYARYLQDFNIQSFSAQHGINPFHIYEMHTSNVNGLTYHKYIHYIEKFLKEIGCEYLAEILSTYKPTCIKRLLEVIIKKKNSPLQTIRTLTNNMSYIDNDLVEFAAANHFKALKFFIEKKKVKPSRVCNKENQTPIIIAAIHNQSEAIEYLINLNPELLKAKDNYNFTIIDYALSNRNIEILQVINKHTTFNNIAYSLKTFINQITQRHWHDEGHEKTDFDFLQYYFKNIFPHISQELKHENEIAIKDYFIHIVNNLIPTMHGHNNNQFLLDYINLFYEKHLSTLNNHLASNDLNRVINNFAYYISELSDQIISELLKLDIFNTHDNWSKLFFVACINLYYQQLENLLSNKEKNRMDINYSMTYYKNKNNSQINLNPLQLAIEKNNLELFTFLVNNGANINYSYKDPKYESNSFKNIFDYICKRYGEINYEMLDLLLHNNFDKSSSDAPFIAIKNDNIQLLHYLIENKFDIHKTDANKHNLLYQYINRTYYRNESPNLEIVKTLLQNNLSIQQETIHIAAEKGFIEVVKLLLEENVDINQLSKEGNTPLLFTIKEMWFNKDYNNDNGHTQKLLIKLSELKHIIQFLLENNALVCIKNSEEQTALDIFEKKFKKELEKKEKTTSSPTANEIIKKKQEMNVKLKNQVENEKKIRKDVKKIHTLLTTKAQEEKNDPETMKVVEQYNTKTKKNFISKTIASITNNNSADQNKVIKTNNNSADQNKVIKTNNNSADQNKVIKALKNKYVSIPLGIGATCLLSYILYSCFLKNNEIVPDKTIVSET